MSLMEKVVGAADLRAKPAHSSSWFSAGNDVLGWRS